MPNFASLDALERLHRLSQTYGTKTPAEYAGIADPYTALCFDEAALIAGRAAEARAYREAQANAENPDADPNAAGAIAELAPGKAPTIRGTIPIRRKETS